MCLKQGLPSLGPVLLILLAVCSMYGESQAYCSLEKMKHFAMEACEHLFLQEDVREKRSLTYDDHPNLLSAMAAASSKYYYDNKEQGAPHHRTQPHYYTTVRRSVYPHGGYLKMGHEHYRLLSQVNVFPKYKAKKVHHDEKEKERFKREHSSSYNNIPYCCYNRCDEDFLC